MSYLDTSQHCIFLTVLLIGVAASLTWIEFAILQRAQPRLIRSGLPDPRLGIAAGCGLLLFGWQPFCRFLLLLLLAYVVVQFASKLHFGREGSDEIALIIVLPLTLAAAPISDHLLERISLGFIAAQLLLAYLASASAKLLGQKWRDGRAVAQVLSTADYGLGRSSLYHSDLLIFRQLSRATIAFEFLLPLFLILGGPFLVIALVAGASFHATVSFVMGLNRFFPWFLAAYPAVAWASLHYGLLAP